MKKIMYNPQPIDVSDVVLSSDLEDLIEALAENVHDTWAKGRMDDGWTYGPVRDDVRKHNAPRCQTVTLDIPPQTSYTQPKI